VGFGGTLLLVIGLAMQAAVVLLVLMKLVRPVLGWAMGFLGRMAPSGLINNLSRTSVAAAALMVAVAVTIGMQLMVGSFRTTVAVWLEQTLGGDIYISAPSFISTHSTESIDPVVIRQAEDWPDLRRLDTLRTVSVESEQGPVVLNATRNPDLGIERMYVRLEMPETQIWPALEEGSILVTEALVYRLGLDESEASLRLLTDTGWQDFSIAATIYEYTSSEGSVWMADSVYRRYWQDSGVTALSLRLVEGADIEGETQRLRQALSGVQRLNIRSNRTLRGDVMEVFDRTFAITRAMQMMVTVVAFVGVLNTALLLQMEKHRESGILRALGLTGRQLRRLVMLETGLIGLAAGLMAIPTGYAIARVLVDVINQRSFGWTLQLFTPAGDFLQGVLLAVGASL
ncbi:MAG: ABC transporter permease, partial [Anaerolineaceae bacterium]